MMTRTDGGDEWSTAHNSRFELKKFALIEFVPPRRCVTPNTFKYGGRDFTAKQAHRFLGVIFDPTLSWKPQVQRAVEKGTKFVALSGRLARPFGGLQGKHIRRLYRAVAVPKMIINRLATLPASHPLHQVVRACHRDRHKTRKHLTPLENLITAFPIPIPEIETIRPVQYAKNTTHLFTVSIPRSRDASEKADQATQLAPRFSVTDRGWTPGQERLQSSQHQIYRARDPGPTTICLDNQAVLLSLTRRDSATGQHIFDEIHAQVLKVFRKHQFSRRGFWLEFRWITGHSEVEGNEAADTEAKKASRGETSEDGALPELLRDGRRLPFSVGATRQALEKHPCILECSSYNQRRRSREFYTLRVFTPTRWAESPRRAKLHLIDNTLPSPKLEALPREAATHIIQLRTRKIALAKYFHRIGKVDSPGEESVEHFLLKCSRWNGQRFNIFKKELGRDACKTSVLLNTAKGMRLTTEFIKRTERFLRTHNSDD
ncbi:hypothetical protein BDV98DRAFT_659157 [Pterulicium gracile]|uniref:Uncharacterized protein n=1 Tax=Pterulicium gracile TaxID=1884261 RepID=A0A5C3Q3R5_9AGAR|nr:hypothetical protein BDV98DRAFT_659157 [Pterula gracilis]